MIHHGAAITLSFKRFDYQGAHGVVLGVQTNSKPPP